MSKYQRAISVSGTLYAQLKQHAAARGQSLAGTIEPLILAALNDGWTPSGLAAFTEVPVRRVLRDHVEVEVSLGIYELVDDQVVRARELAGQQLTHEALFEAALQQALAAEGA